MLKDSFRTTNCIENVNSLIAQLTHSVRRWTNFIPASPLGSYSATGHPASPSEVRGYQHLPMLRRAIQTELGIKQLAKTGQFTRSSLCSFQLRLGLDRPVSGSNRDS